MTSNFRKKTSNLLITALIGIIVVSFMFTGNLTSGGTPDTIANVGGKLIKIKDYQLEFKRQLQTFKQFFGGKELSSQQIEQFKLKDTALRNLIDRKLIVTFGEQLGIYTSPNQLKKIIKDLPYFKTSGQFDLNRYKALLAANEYTPKQFEKNMDEDNLGALGRKYFSYFPFSDGYIKDLIRFKEMKKNLNIVEIDHDALRKYLNVSKSEIRKYLENEANEARVENTFNERQKSLSTEEQIKTSHLLIKSENGKPVNAKKRIDGIYKKINKKNFSKLAKKHTEDPSGKVNGGDLGFIKRGQMVPAFEKMAFSLKVGEISKPIKSRFGYHIIYVRSKKAAIIAKLKDHQSKISIEFIRKEKNDELKTLLSSVKAQTRNALEKNNSRGLDRLQKKYGLKVERDTQINKYEGNKGSIHIKRELISEIFTQKERLILEDSGATKTVLFIEKKLVATKNKIIPPSLLGERNALDLAFSNKISQAVIKHFNEVTKVKVFTQLIR